MLLGSTYAGLDTLSHLTRLEVSSSEIHCVDDCKFASSLKSLLVRESSLIRFHTNGLSACSSLQSLQLESATIRAVNNVDNLAISDVEQPIVPGSLSALDALTALRCNISNIDLPVRLHWLSHLTSLQDLHLDVRLHQLVFPKATSSLKQLTKLDIVADAQINFNFNWAELVGLKEMLISGSFEIPYNLVDVALIKALKHVRLASPQGSQNTIQQIGRLAHVLGATRPDVLFEL